MNRSILTERLPSALNVGVLLFLFLPLMVYAFNLDSVTVSKTVIAKAGILCCLAITLFLGLLCCISKLGRGVGAGCRVLALIIFVMTVFPNRTGEITGFGSFLASADNTLAFAKLGVLLGLGLFLAWQKPKILIIVDRVLLVLALVISAYILTFELSVSDKAWGEQEREKTYFSELGKKKNIIVLVLDGFTGYRMVEILDQHPEFIDAFPGFVLYPRAIANAVNTAAGISTILTGDLEIALTVEDWSERNTKSLKESFLADAQGEGMDCGFVSTQLPSKTDIPVYEERKFYMIRPTTLSNCISEYRGFWTVSLARILPAVVYAAVEPILEASPEEGSSGYMADLKVFESLGNRAKRNVLASKMSLNYFVETCQVGNGPAKALFFHSKMSHPPFILSETGEYDQGADYKSASVYAIRVMENLMKKLKKLGCYESSLIIITADHGHGLMPAADPSMGGVFTAGQSLAFAYNPLLMVKSPNASHPLRESQMSVWLGDVAATVRDFLGTSVKRSPMFASRSLFKADDLDRELALPLFFKPDQLDYHSTLSKWARVDVVGQFKDFGPVCRISPDDLLREEALVTLFAGVDELRTRWVAQGWMSGEETQYRAVIEVNDRPMAKIYTRGVVVISNKSGKSKIHIFKEPAKGLAFLAGLNSKNDVLAAGLHVPAKMVLHHFDRKRPGKVEAGELNFVYAAGKKFNYNEQLHILDGDVRLDLEWK